MDDREFFLARRKAELPAFLSVLEALPADRLDYKPHENSPSAQQLAGTLTTELGAGAQLAKTPIRPASASRPRRGPHPSRP